VSLIPFTILWVILAVALIALVIYRRLIAVEEDDSLHIGPGEESKVLQQTALAKKLDVIDRWWKILTIVVIVYGLALAVIYGYVTFMASSSVRIG